MPKAPNMYKCSNFARCGGYMTHRERNKKRVIITRPNGAKVQFDEDLCPSCEAEETEGKELKQLKSATGKDSGEEQESTHSAVSAGEHPAPKTNGVPARRGRPVKEGDSAPRPRSRSATSGAR